MNIFWGFLAVFFVFATFGAWREQVLKVEKHNAKRPDFFHPASGDQVKSWVDTTGHHPTLKIDFVLRFENRGDAIACDPIAEVFACWVKSNPPEVFLIDRVESVARVATGGHMNYPFSGSHLVGSLNGRPIVDDHYILVILFEIESHANSADGELHRNEIWIGWHPKFGDRTTSARPDEVRIAKEAINRFKAAQGASMQLP